MGKINRFIISQWCSIPQRFLFDDDGNMNTWRLDENIDSGINLVPVSYSPELNKRAIEYCNKRGVMCTVEDNVIASARLMKEGWQAELDGRIAFYKDIEGVANYHIQDEPNKKDFDGLARVTSRIKEVDPVHQSYINLFPNYANRQQLGHDTYYEHVEDYIKIVQPELISYDHYHFLNRERKMRTDIQFSSERERLIYEDAYKATSRDREGFFDNIEVIRELSVKYGIPFMVIILVTEHGSYRNLTEAEIRWEVYQSMVYGAKGISYFTYWTPGYDEMWQWNNGMLLANGDKAQHYYDVKNINKDLIKVGELLFDKDSLAVFNVGLPNESVKPFESFGGVENIEARMATVGFFTDDIMLIANRDYVAEQTVTVVTQRELERFDKDTSAWVKTDKTVTIKPGDGEVFRLI